MHAAALGQIGQTQPKKDDDIDVASAPPESITIVALRDDLSQQALRILHERHLSTNPVRAYMRNMRCTEVFGDVPALNDGRSAVSSASGLPSASKSPGSSYMRLVTQMMPVVEWFPKLNAKIVRGDIIAGLTVGVMCIPQSMSYANIAGLEYIYGMYSACVPTLIYGLFGQSRQLAVGPVAMVSLLVEAGLNGQLTKDQARTPECRAWFEASQDVDQYKGCKDEYAELAFLASLAVGVMQVLASVLKLGFIVSFLGHPVTSGFTSGAAIIIGLSQVKYILGYKIAKSQYVLVTLEEIFSKIGKTRAMTCVLGLVWLTFLIVNKKVSQRYPKLKLLGALGPLISCVVGIALIGLYKPLREDFEVDFVGDIPSGLMPISVTTWSMDSLPLVMPTAATACLIGYMESVAIGKSLAAKHGYEIDAGQELLALGIANIVGGCFSCYPVTGSFSRSAVMNSTGGLSQLGGIISAVVMFLTLMFLTPCFYYLPKFALAAIVISSVLPLIAFQEARKLYKVKKNDFILWVVAFLGTMLLGVLYGILVAVTLSLVIVIYESVRPQITILWRIPGTAIYRNVKQESSGVFIPNVFICRIGSSMYFANASFIKDTILAYINDLEDCTTTEYIVLEMTSVVSVDSTAVHVLQDFVNDFLSRGIHVAFAMVGNRVEKTLRKAGLKEFIGEQWFFPTVNEAVRYCLRHQIAKRRAKKKNRISQDSAESQPGEDTALTEDVDWSQGFEIECNNHANPENTLVIITLAEDIPMIMSEITAIFRKYQIRVVRAQVEPQEKGGAKHTYFVKNIKSNGKLQDAECERLQDDLEGLIKAHSRSKNSGKPSPVLLGGCTSPPDTAGPVVKGKVSGMYQSPGNDRHSDRLRRLEDRLTSEQSVSQDIQIPSDMRAQQHGMSPPRAQVHAAPVTSQMMTLAAAHQTFDLTADKAALASFNAKEATPLKGPMHGGPTAEPPIRRAEAGDSPAAYSDGKSWKDGTNSEQDTLSTMANDEGVTPARSSPELTPENLIPEPLRELAYAFEPWLRQQEALTNSEMIQFEAQLRLYKKIVAVYEDNPDPLPDAAQVEVKRHLQELQSMDAPPKDLLRQIAVKHATEERMKEARAQMEHLAVNGYGPTLDAPPEAKPRFEAPIDV